MPQRGVIIDPPSSVGYVVVVGKLKKLANVTPNPKVSLLQNLFDQKIVYEIDGLKGFQAGDGATVIPGKNSSTENKIYAAGLEFPIVKPKYPKP